VKLSSKKYLIWWMQILPSIRSLKLMKHLTLDLLMATTLDESNKEVPNPRFEEL